MWAASIVITLYIILYCTPTLSEITKTQESSSNARNVEFYLTKRRELLAKESSHRIGRDVVLNEKEQVVNELIMLRKRAEYETSVKSGVFPPARNFMNAKKDIDQSRVFQIIKKMPKGAVLHIHDITMVNLNWVIANVTYREHCYIGIRDHDEQVLLTFSQEIPLTKGYTWNLVSNQRRNASSPAAFDQWLKSHMTVVVPDPDRTYTNHNEIWVKFTACLAVIRGLILYDGVFPDYIYESLREAVLDNVQYIETRASLKGVYALDGSIQTTENILHLFKNASDKFVNDHPDFLGVKLIYSPVRFGDPAMILESVKEAIRLHRKYPTILLGMDLVDREDSDFPLRDFLGELLYPRVNGLELRYFFHSGETVWQGNTVDTNLVDAVLLNTTRIGHGYALLKHPEVMRLVKDKPIPIEVNPISNQVLGLLRDLRNHPMAALIAQDYPIVISSDDPAIWGADFLSHDFYVTFMALTGEDTDLRFLKAVASNSIKYSGMSREEQTKAFRVWKQKWDDFIDDIRQNFE